MTQLPEAGVAVDVAVVFIENCIACSGSGLGYVRSKLDEVIHSINLRRQRINFGDGLITFNDCFVMKARG